jgi:hypothetical protein
MKNVGVKGVLTIKENAVVLTWILAKQKVGLSIIIQQLKLKVIEITKLDQHHFKMRFHRIVGGIGLNGTV